MPFNVFISYARADQKFREALVTHLKPLEKVNKIKVWHDGLIEAGDKWLEKVKENLKTCDVAVFLVSADFLASDFIQDIEIKMLLEREENGEVLIFPILIKDCLFKDSKLSQFQALPRDLKPIKSPTNNQAWLQISEAVNNWYQTWEENKQIYFEQIKNHYGKIRLLGHYENTELEGIFTDLYILDQLSAQKFYSFDNLPKKHEDIRNWCVGKNERQNGIELVKSYQFQRLYILGKPGAGKTTFLKYILLEAVKGQINNIPIFISLKEWAESKLSLNNFLIKQLIQFGFQKANSYLKHLLNTNIILLLFDGLDEVNQENKQRYQLVEIIKEFTQQYPNVSCLVTCRIAANEYNLSSFTYAELADFSNQEITQYVQKWFKNEPVKANLFLDEFSKEEHQGLQELGRIPLLLSLLCLAFNDNNCFPIRRIDIYSDALDSLLRKWDGERNIIRDEAYKGLSLKRKNHLFSHIAYNNFIKNSYFFEQQRLSLQIEKYLARVVPEISELDGYTLLKSIEAQHGIFVERAQKIYAFGHLTFQEYYSAKYAVDNEAKGTLQELLPYYNETQWHEVFLLISSLLDDADVFFTQFRKNLDNLIVNDLKIINFLNYSHDKSLLVNLPYQCATVRSFYCFLFLFRVRPKVLNHDLTPNKNTSHSQEKSEKAKNIILERSHILELDLTRAYEQSRNFSLNFISTLDNNLANKLCINSIQKISLDISLIRDFDAVLDILSNYDFSFPEDINLKVDLLLSISYQFVCIFSSLDESIYLSLENKSMVFYNFFDKLLKFIVKQDFFTYKSLETIIMHNNTQTSWRNLKEQLDTILDTQCKLKLNWDFNKEQYKRLSDYLKANLFFIECLKLASVDKELREKLLDSLLLPPNSYTL